MKSPVLIKNYAATPILQTKFKVKDLQIKSQGQNLGN